MPTPDQRIAEVAIARAAAQAAAADAAKRKGTGAPSHNHSHTGGNMLAAIFTVVLLVATLALAIFANR